MSDIGLSNGLNTNANLENEHASAAAGATSDGALHASEGGVAYDGSADAGGAVQVDAPETPELDAAGEAQATLDATVQDAHAKVDATVEGATGVDLPDADGSIEGALGGGVDVSGSEGGVDLSAMWDGMLDVMGDLVVQFSGAVTGVLGF